MALTRSQIERLGERLVRSDPPAADDLAALHELLLAYGDALAEAVAVVQDDLGITPSSRVKTTGTILEKLERYGGSWLKSIQDLAGMRIVGRFDRRGQDALVARLVDLFADGGRSPKVTDRRAKPSHGYRAVHVVVFVRSLPVEIQVRTALQHEWADLFEKLADKIGRQIRYGEPPEHWLSASQRDALPQVDRYAYNLTHQMRLNSVTIAGLVAETIEAYERREITTQDDAALRNGRRRVDDALRVFERQLEYPLDPT
jgi:ppGpp synthetase/RelA/SpoT-type nucleotidyltranferase